MQQSTLGELGLLLDSLDLIDILGMCKLPADLIAWVVLKAVKFQAWMQDLSSLSFQNYKFYEWQICDDGSVVSDS